MTDHLLRVLTLNVWGAPYAVDRPARMQAISERIKQLDPDIICFQETYLEADRDRLLNDLSIAGWHSEHYFASGFIGSGLLTISRYPIIDAAFHRFRMSGKPERLNHGDYYAGKGIGLTRILSPAGPVDVYNLHPHAQYDPVDDNEYAVYTDSNLYEACRFIHNQSVDNPVIVCGDFNVRPDQTGYNLVTRVGRLVDTFAICHPDSPGITFSAENPYVDTDNQRLDYIMLQHNRRSSIQIRSSEIVLNSVDTAKSPVPAYSDHYGIMTEFILSDGAPAETDSTTSSGFSGQEAGQALANLHLRLQDAMHQTRITSNTCGERAMFSFAAIGDILLFGTILRRRLRAGKYIQALLLIAALFSGVYHLLQAQLNLRTRLNTLEAIANEVDKQLKAHQIFDGRTW